jgi:ABC-type taurine transport system substrate-binding protein
MLHADQQGEYTVVPGDAVVAWRERTGSVTREFAAKHPEVMQRFNAVAGVE